MGGTKPPTAAAAAAAADVDVAAAASSDGRSGDDRCGTRHSDYGGHSSTSSSSSTDGGSRTGRTAVPVPTAAHRDDDSSASSSDPVDEYVVVVPRGFEGVAADAIRSSMALASPSDNDECGRGQSCGGGGGRGGEGGGDGDGEERYSCRVGPLFPDDDEEQGAKRRDLLRRLEEQRELAERHQRDRRRMRNNNKIDKNDGTRDGDNGGDGGGIKKPRREEGGVGAAEPATTTAAAAARVDLPNVGTVRHPDGTETSVGYYRRRAGPSPSSDVDEVVTAGPGRDGGFDLLLLVTDAPAYVVARHVRSAGCGPLLALVVHGGGGGGDGSGGGGGGGDDAYASDDLPSSGGEVPSTRRLTHDQGWDEAREVLERVMGNGDGDGDGDRDDNAAVLDGYRRALDLWARHARLWRRRWGEECFFGGKGKAGRRRRTKRCGGGSEGGGGGSGKGTGAPSSGDHGRGDDDDESEKEDFGAELEKKIRGEVPLTFRGSCVRVRGARRSSSKFEYRGSRQDLMAVVGSSVPVGALRGVPLLLPPPAKAKPAANPAGEGGTPSSPRPTLTPEEAAAGPWRVDLTNYDFEVVGFVLPCDRVALCISLLPYNHLGANSFAGSSLPTDVSPPFVGGGGISNLVRLKPSIASMLLHVADLEEGDVVVDPCGGIGTVTVEAALAPRRRLVGIGGDVVAGLSPIAATYMREAGRYRTRNNVNTNGRPGPGAVDGCGASDYLTWDATLLPLRDGCADAVVSDLPFGQRCMSHSGLLEFLPPMVAEVARVLRPSRGRVVFLTGGTYRLVVDALARAGTGAGSGASLFEMPPASVFPVNIGGLSAWVVFAVRSSSSVVVPGGPAPKLDHLERVRRMTASRERNARCEEAWLRNDVGGADGDGDAGAAGPRRRLRLQR